MKRSRPSSHYRVIKTKKGRKRILVNKGVKKKINRRRMSRLELARKASKTRKNDFKSKLDYPSVGSPIFPEKAGMSIISNKDISEAPGNTRLMYKRINIMRHGRK